MAFQFKNNFNEGINLDLDELRMPPNAAVFIKNLTDNVNTNQNAPGATGSNARVRTPIEGNQALSISGMPTGTNFCTGFYSSEQSNEGYFTCYNSNNDHTIWVISGDTGAVRKVYQSSLLPFILDPSYFLAEGRMTLELISTIDPTTEQETNFKLLVLSNNRGFQVMIDVEASIATSSYSTPYFTDSAAFYDELELINLGSALPIKAIGINDPDPYVPVDADLNKQNLIINAGWQFRIRTWDIWGRPSEWGIISSVATVLTGGGCISTSNGLARCFNLCFDAGSPLIKFITVAYRRGVGNDPSGQTETDWYETETFRKYDDSTGVQWYERPINPAFATSGSGMTFDDTTNIITYTFCADKGSNPVDPTEASRTEPGIPRFSGSAFSVNKAVGLANNVYGFEPVSQEVINAIDFSVKLPDPLSGQVPCPAAETRTITVYAHIYNAFTNQHPYIRKTFGIYTFGDGGNDIAPNTPTCDVSNFSIGQVFGDQANPGFIAYLAGTPFKVRGVWGDYDPVADVFTPQPIDTIGSFPNIKMIRFQFVDVPAGKYVCRLASHHANINDGNLQQTSTQVAGCCPIRNAQISWGCRVGYFSNPIKELVVDCSIDDANEGGLDHWMFVILDLNDGVRSNGIDGYLYEEEGGAPVEMAVCYIHGDTLGQPGDAYGSFFTDHNGYYFMTSGSHYAGIDILSSLCDGGPMYGVFSQTSGCGGSTGKMAHGSAPFPRNPDYYGNFGSWSSRVYIARPGGVVTTYPETARRRIKQKFTVCSQPTLGVPGIPVVMTRCQPELTNSSGLATITAHNRYNYLTAIGGSAPPFGSNVIPDYGSSPGNQDLLIFSQKGGCEWNDCGNCKTYMDSVVVDYVDCCPIPPDTCTRITTLPDKSVQPNGVGIYGVQSGAKYPLAFWLHDVIGRHTSPQIKTGELGYVYTPNLNEVNTPYPAMALCSLQVTIPSSIVVDPVFTHMTVLVGQNCLFSDFFTWAADWVQYVDNTGVTNTTNPTAIRIYFGSLNEYNKQYNFSTNVGWDFIVKTPGQTLPSDIVQFIMNGDGEYLTYIKGAPITYGKFGTFFTIDYQPELEGLQNGCLFRVIRPKQNSTGGGLPYYEQSLTLDIVDGLLPAGTYAIPYQDSYLLSRFIPVPIMAGIISSGVVGTASIVPVEAKRIGFALGSAAGYAVATLVGATPGTPNTYDIIGDQGGGVAPGAAPPYPLVYTNVNNTENNISDGESINEANGIVIFTNKDYPATFPFFFESPSASDLSMSHLASKGRVGIPNPYEQQYRVGTEIAISNPIADRGIVNGMGVFQSSNRQVFDRNTWGDITSVLVEVSVCLVICDRDHFAIRYNGNQLKVGTDGAVFAQNQYGIFTSPERRPGTNYGCGAAQINTIRKYAGVVRWLDVTGYVVIHNFSSADSNTDDAGYLGYMLNKIAQVNIQNLSPGTYGKTYFIAGIDVKNYEYQLTVFNIPPVTAPSYINTQSQPVLNRPETFVFDLKTSRLKSFASYTPEFYGQIPGYFSQRQFLAFKNGVPYIQHANYASGTPPLYCNFFGVQCEFRITHVVNGVDGKTLPDKVKRFFWNEIYCRQSISGGSGVMPSALFYADVITSEKGQSSRLLVARWDLKDGYQTASFLCDLNTPADPNLPTQTGANKILDGNPLQGRWLKISGTNNPSWAGTYFEMSEWVTYINGLEKSAD